MEKSVFGHSVSHQEKVNNINLRNDTKLRSFPRRLPRLFGTGHQFPRLLSQAIAAVTDGKGARASTNTGALRQEAFAKSDCLFWIRQ